MSSDLDSLIQQTEKSIQDTDIRSRKTRNRHGSSTTARHGLLIGLIAVTAFSVYTIVDELTPMAALDDRAIQADMLRILRQASVDVESNRDARGRPPEILPNSALSNVVYYRVNGDSYELTLFLNGNTAMRDFNGQLLLNGETINE